MRYFNLILKNIRKVFLNYTKNTKFTTWYNLLALLFCFFRVYVTIDLPRMPRFWPEFASEIDALCVTRFVCLSRYHRSLTHSFNTDITASNSITTKTMGYDLYWSNLEFGYTVVPYCVNQDGERVVFTVCTEDDDEDSIDDHRVSPLPDPHDFLLPDPSPPHLPLYDPDDDADPRGYFRSPGLTHSTSDSGLPMAKPDTARCGSRCARPYSVVNLVRTVFSSHFLPRL